MISNSPRRIRKAFFLKQESPLMIQVRSKDFLLLNNWRLWFAFPSGQSKGGAGVGVWVEPLKFTGKGAAWKIPCFLTPGSRQQQGFPGLSTAECGASQCGDHQVHPWQTGGQSWFPPHLPLFLPPACHTHTHRLASVSLRGLINPRAFPERMNSSARL